MSVLLESIRDTIKRHEMLAPGQTVVVGVSGGADSVALLHALWTLRDELELQIIVAHLNHGIRGVEADSDASFVEELAERLGLPSVIEKVDVPAVRRQLGLGLEEAARKVRYEFLEEVAVNARAARIAVAHTADDQVETVLLNIIRGTGPDGLTGMLPVRGKIIRPLIEVFRQDVESYLKENGLEWRTDVTNLDLYHARNRVRLELIPMLQERFNPRVKEAILSLSLIARDEAEVVRTATEQAFEAAVKEAGPVEVAFDAAVLGQYPRAIRRRCLRMAIETVKGDLRDVEYEQVERLVERLERGEKFTFTLPSGVIYAELSKGALRVFRKVEVPRVKVTHELAVPGRTEAPELGVVLETAFVPPETRPENPYQAVVDAGKLAGRLVVRTWEPGDRMTPLGMVGHKKLQDIFVDMKVDRNDRVTVPIIADEEKIVWVAGLVVSDEVKIVDSTESALLIEYSRFKRLIADC